MSVFVRRGGSAETKQYAVEIIRSSSTSERYAALKIGGASLSAGTYMYDQGTEIVCTVSAQNSMTNSYCYISVDGVNVLSSAGSYTYKVNANCKIVASTSSREAMGSSFTYGYITITTV